MPDATAKPLLVYSANTDLLKRIQRALEVVDVQVLASSRPRDFLVAIKRGRYAGLAADISSRRPDPEDLLRAVRKLNADAPFWAFVPEERMSELLPRALSLGADDVIALPARPLELQARIATRLHGSSRPSVARPSTSSVAAPAPQTTAVDSALLRDLASFHERCLRRFIGLERELLATRERLSEVSGLVEPGDEDLDTPQQILLVHPNPHLGEHLEAHCRELPVEIHQVFTGGGALDRAGQATIDAVVCSADLPDLDGAIIATSLKGEYPYIDAFELRAFGTPEGRAVLLHEDDQERAATTLEDLGAVIELIVARNARRQADKRLALAFREKHAEFMRQYAALKIRLLRALDELAPGASAPFRLSSPGRPLADDDD